MKLCSHSLVGPVSITVFAKSDQEPSLTHNKMVLIRPEETDSPEAHHEDGAGMSNSLIYDPESLRVEDSSPSPVPSTSVHTIECLDKPEVVMLRLQGRSQQITPRMSLTDHHHQHHPGVCGDDADQVANCDPSMQQAIPRKPGQLDAGETALHVFAELTISPPENQKVHKPVEPHGSVPFYQLFSFADSIDYFLMVVGTFGAIIHGAALPVFFLFFGKLLNGFGANSNNPHYAAHIVAKVGESITIIHDHNPHIQCFPSTSAQSIALHCFMKENFLARGFSCPLLYPAMLMRNLRANIQ